eukprot:scaffold20814_cov197-Skeletonema_marinoi.AAC.1
MGHWKLWIAIFTALDTIWWFNVDVVGSPIGPHQVTYDVAASPISRSLDTIWWFIVDVAASPIGPHHVTYDVAASPISRCSA